MKKPIRRKSNMLFEIDTYEGEAMVVKLRRMLDNNEPITDGAETIYTEKKDGVRPEFDVRTDRFEIALDAIDKQQKALADEIAKATNTPGADGTETDPTE